MKIWKMYRGRERKGRGQREGLKAKECERKGAERGSSEGGSERRGDLENLSKMAWQRETEERDESDEGSVREEPGKLEKHGCRERKRKRACEKEGG